MEQTGRIRQIPYYFAQIARKVIHNYSPHLSRQNFVLLFRSRWHNSRILRTKCSTPFIYKGSSLFLSFTTWQAKTPLIGLN